LGYYLQDEPVKKVFIEALNADLQKKALAASSMLIFKAAL
jgi:hypothetical protein